MATVTFPTIVNNAESTLDIAHTNSVTTITLATGGVAALGLTGTTNAIISIITQGTYQQNPETSEIIHVTGDSGDTLTGATRGFDGSSAKTFSAGDIVEVRVVKSHIQQIYDTLNDGTKSISVFAGIFAGNIDILAGAKLKVGEGIDGFSGLSDDIVISDSSASGTNVGMSILSATNGTGYLFFGDQANNVACAIQVNNSSGVGTMNLTAGTNDLNLTLSGEAGSEIATFAGSVLVKPGGTTPVIAPSDDVLTGFYFPSNDFMVYKTGGTQSFEINNSGQATFAFQANFDGVVLGVGVGTATRFAPTYSFTGDSNTGIYSDVAGSVKITNDNLLSLTIDSSLKATFVGAVDVGGDLSFDGKLNIGPAEDLDVVSGAATFTQMNHKVIPETGTSDTLHTINGGVDGDRIRLRPSIAGDTITLTNASNLKLGTSPRIMSTVYHFIELEYVVSVSGNRWVEMSFVLNS